MFVRLMADTSQFMTSMTAAAEKATQTAERVESATKRIESMQNSLKGFAQSALGLLGSFGVASSLGGMFESFNRMEESMIRLISAIKVSGLVVESVTKDYKEFAKQIGETTTVSKGQTMALLRSAEMHGLQGEKAKEAAKIALSLAGATGQSAESQMHIAEMMARGHPEFARRALGLRDVKDKTELVTEINKRLAAGWDVQQEL